MRSTTPEPDPSDQAASGRSVTSTMEDYLRHIYKLEEEGNDRVSNSTVAERLGVSQPTVTSMFRTLADRGLIEREKYRPVRLTDDGRAVALATVRKHRLVETMLTEVFGYDISGVDREADVLEHHLSDRLCREIERVLDAPEIDPHGDPIPTADLDIRGDETAVPLADASNSSSVEVTRILTQDDEIIDYLVSRDIKPGARLAIDETTAVGMIVVTVLDSQRRESLPRSVSTRILVTPEDPS